MANDVSKYVLEHYNEINSKRYAEDSPFVPRKVKELVNKIPRLD